MKISDNYRCNNVMYKGFKISFDAEPNLRRLPVDIVADIFDVARKLEKTEYIDLELLSTMDFRIKEKGNVFSGMKEPIKVFKPKEDEKSIKVTGIYDGVNSGEKRRGQICQTFIDYVSYAEAIKGYEIIQRAASKVARMGLIVNELDRSKMLNAEKNNPIRPKTKFTLCEYLINKYSDIVREFRD